MKKHTFQVSTEHLSRAINYINRIGGDSGVFEEEAMGCVMNQALRDAFPEWVDMITPAGGNNAYRCGLRSWGPPDDSIWYFDDEGTQIISLFDSMCPINLQDKLPCMVTVTRVR